MFGLLERIAKIVVGALALTAVAAGVPRARAHGFLANPPSRNLLASRAGAEHDAQSLNGGGRPYGSLGTHSMTFRLPAGFACERCVLRWYWLTGNSCDPPGAVPTGTGACGAGGATPEEFWNCADVRIVAAPKPTPKPQSPTCEFLKKPSSRGKTFVCEAYAKGVKWAAQRGAFVMTAGGPRWYASEAAWKAGGKKRDGVVRCNVLSQCKW